MWLWPTRRRLLAGIAAALGFPSPANAQGAEWPQRALRIIIPTAPGGSPDLVARLLGSKLTERLGQPMIVESVTQGVGILANQMVSKSAPDGYTFAMLTGGFTTQAAVVKTLPYDPVRDFSPVTTVARQGFILLVHPAVMPVTRYQLAMDYKRDANYGTAMGRRSTSACSRPHSTSPGDG